MQDMVYPLELTEDSMASSSSKSETETFDLKQKSIRGDPESLSVDSDLMKKVDHRDLIDEQRVLREDLSIEMVQQDISFEELDIFQKKLNSESSLLTNNSKFDISQANHLIVEQVSKRSGNKTPGDLSKKKEAPSRFFNFLLSFLYKTFKSFNRLTSCQNCKSN